MKLFLDVDDVINHHPGCQFDDAEINYRQHFPIQTSPTVGRALLATGCEIVWLTTWGENANRDISPLMGFPTDLAVADAERPWTHCPEGRPCPASFSWWKFHWMYHNAPDEPFIWLDDDLTDEAFKWVKTLRHPTLLIKPAKDVGLRQEHLDVIAKFAKDH